MADTICRPPFFLWTFDLKITLPVTHAMRNFSSNSESERCTIFRFQVNRERETDGWTDGLTERRTGVMHIAPSYGGPHNNNHVFRIRSISTGLNSNHRLIHTTTDNNLYIYNIFRIQSRYSKHKTARPHETTRNQPCSFNVPKTFQKNPCFKVLNTSIYTKTVNSFREKTDVSLGLLLALPYKKVEPHRLKARL